MRRYVDYLTKSQAKDHIVSYGLGDWSPYEAQTPADITSTGYFYRDARIIADTAKLLGKSDDATKYERLAADIATAFNKKFFDEKNATYANGTQTALSCASTTISSRPRTVNASSRISSRSSPSATTTSTPASSAPST